MRVERGDALLVIDVQRDFLPGGALAVTRGDEVVPVINALGARFDEVVLTQDWHPAGHISFAETHGKQPFTDTVEATYGTQALWPVHCVQESAGAELHEGLELPRAGMVLRKGFQRAMDSYSAFLENDHTTSTGLAGYLRDRGLQRLFLSGLATDYCVGFSALDGRAMGFDVVVIEDAVRGISPEGMAAMRDRWRSAGVTLIQSGAIER